MSLKPFQSPSILHIDLPRFGWFKCETQLHLNVCRVLFALFVIHTFASSVYLSLCFLEKLNRLTFTLSIHLCFIYLFTH